MLSSSAKLLVQRAIGATTTTTAGQPLALAAKCLSTAVAATQQNKPEELTILRLNNLQDNPGAVKKGRRVGRGIGSSKGKTCGKGHKGQRARNRSSIPNGFEGGQTKFYKLLPKKGFNNKRHRAKQGADMQGLNLGVIQDYIDMGRFTKLSHTTTTSSSTLSDDEPFVTLGVVDFIEAGIFKKTPSLAGIKLLAGGKERFTANVRLEVNRASEEAIAAAEQAGGQVTTMHFNRLAMRALIRPDKFSKIGAAVAVDDEDGDVVEGTQDGTKEEERYLLPKQARPPPKLQPYYTSWKNRGYLCPQVQMREWLDARPDLQEAFQASLKIAEDDDKKETEASAVSSAKED